MTHIGNKKKSVMKIDKGFAVTGSSTLNKTIKMDSTL